MRKTIVVLLLLSLWRISVEDIKAQDIYQESLYNRFSTDVFLSGGQPLFDGKSISPSESYYNESISSEIRFTSGGGLEGDPGGNGTGLSVVTRDATAPLSGALWAIVSLAIAYIAYLMNRRKAAGTR